MADTVKARLHSESKRSSILRELRVLTQKRKAQQETVLGRFFQCRELQMCSALLAKAVDQCALARRKTSPASRRLSASDLMALRCDFGLPLLGKISSEQRFLAGDREAIALAEVLARTGIAIAEDWARSERDPTKYLQLTLQRWVGIHGGAAIDRRFSLDVTLSDRLIDYSDKRAPEGTLYLIVDPEGAAFVLFNRTIEMLEQAHPQLPSTFFHHFVGALNRWVRVYDYRDADERVDMLRQWFEGEENADQYELPDVEGCTPKCLKERSLSVTGLKTFREMTKREEVRALTDGLLNLCRISQKRSGLSSPRTWESNSWTRIRHCRVFWRLFPKPMPLSAVLTTKRKPPWR